MIDPADNIALFDRAQLRRNLKRSKQNFNAHSFLFEWTHEQLFDRLLDMTKNFENALQIGARGAKKNAAPSSKIQNLYIIDLEDEKAHVIADEEFLPFKSDSLDLITSALSLHNVNDLPGCLLQINQALKPDGLFMGAMLGGETLFELRQSLNHAEITLKDGLSPRISPFADKPQMGDLLQRAGFNLPVIDSEIITVTYDNMFKLLHDLRGMGQGNIIHKRSRKNPGKAFFMEAAQHYKEHFSDHDGRIRASFEIIFLIGWSPHTSQQKPLKPGSAQMRLADILETKEIQAGEKAHA